MRTPRSTQERRSLPGVLTVMLVALGIAGALTSPLPLWAGEASTVSAPKLMTMHIQGGDILEVLDVLGRTQGINIIVRPGVQGTIPSMDVRDKPVEEVLYLIAQTLGLQVFRADPTTYIVAPPGTEPQLPLVEPYRKPVGQPPSLRVAAGAEPAAPLRVKVAVLGQAIDKLELTADQIRVDPPTDMYTFTAPSAESLRQVLAAAEGIGIQPQEGVLQAGEEQSFEFIWPKDRPQYYLEEVEPDLYRRVELADKEGYLVRVRRSAGKAEITVELEIARRTLSGGRYDEAIRAFVGRPMLTKTVITRTVPLTRDEATLVVWQGAPEPPVSVETSPAPAWAVGEWEITPSPGKPADVMVMTVRRNGAIAIKNVPYPGLINSAFIKPSGQIKYEVTRGELGWRMAGRLNPDGIGNGTGLTEDSFTGQRTMFTWTATKVPGPEAGQGAPVSPVLPAGAPTAGGRGWYGARPPGAAPSWAVGEWEMTGPGEETGLLTVKSDGSVLWTSGTNRWQPADEPRMVFGPGTIDASGQVEIKAALGEEEVWKMTLHGRLNPDGTATGGTSPQGVAWTATKVQGPATEPGAPPWAVGEWELNTSEGAAGGMMSVLPDGTITIKGPDGKGVPGLGSIDPSGQLTYKTVDAEQEITMTMTGRLRPDGTGSGTGHAEGLPAGAEDNFTWTATKVQGPEAQQGAPPWAVGQWRLKMSPSNVTFMVDVLPDGAVVARVHYEEIGKGTIDPSGQVECTVTIESWTLTMTGRLTPERTGGGTIREEARTGSRPPDFGAFWTAHQDLQLIAHTAPPAPETGPAVPIPPAAPGPAGVAVLLELGPPDEAPQIPEQIRALIEQPGPEIQIECKFVEIQKDPDKPLDIGWQDDPQKWLREQLTAGRKAEILNAPRVTTRNNMEAEVYFTTEIPWVWATVTYDEHGNRTEERHEETIPLRHSLYVTPRIAGDNTVVLDLKGEIEKQVGQERGPSAEPIPKIQTRSFSTQVCVRDGETIVIGGFTGTSESLPFVMTAPVEATLVGESFRKRLAAEQNKELLIFVTPKVLPGTAPVSLPEFGAITGEIRDGEQWVWDSIAVRHAEATEVARLFGGQTVTVGPDSLAKTEELMAGAKQPQAPQVGAVTLPIGMDPPLAVVEHNALLVHGTPEAIRQFREILAFFDKPAKQVEIEARFVEVEVKEDSPLGIDSFVANGSAEFFHQGFRPGQGIHVARFRRGRFESELKALLDEGRAEIVNAPRVTTRNNIPATVSFTSEIPYSYATITYGEFGNRKVDYETDSVSVTQSLTVTPRILDDNSVVLDIEAEINDRVGTEIGPDGEVLPVVTTRSASVQVRVPDGDTIVIGGLTRTTEVLDPKQVLPPEETAHTEESERTEMRQTELLLFVTPRILREIPRE